VKVLLFSGTHARHMFIHRALIALGIDYFAIVMDREDVLPRAPEGLPKIDTENFDRHFRDRHAVENATYGAPTVDEIFHPSRMLRVGPQELNSERVLEKVRAFGADMAFIFGCDLIHDPVLSALPEIRINLHLGLSPWYRGGATLFWPFYFLMPQFSGITLHQIVEKADAGAVFHQSVPDLQMGDGIHDVGARAVIQARDDVVAMLKLFEKRKTLGFQTQKTTGRVWRSKDFIPAHLRVIYNLYDNRMVDEYLKGNLSSETPKLIRGL